MGMGGAIMGPPQGAQHLGVKFNLIWRIPDCIKWTSCSKISKAIYTQRLGKTISHNFVVYLTIHLQH